jgi:hypothetical protein
VKSLLVMLAVQVLFKVSENSVNYCVGFEILMAVNMNIIVFWDMVLWSLMPSSSEYKSKSYRKKEVQI